MLRIAPVDRERYLDFVETHPYRNFLQYPSWADLKADWNWSSEWLGWFTADGKMVGGTMVLYRKVPGLNQHLAYIPRGPMIDWISNISLSGWFQPLFQYLKQRNVFSIKMDPPLVKRKWLASTVLRSMHEYQTQGLKQKRLSDIPPDRVSNAVEYVQQELMEMGWHKNRADDSFDTVQPHFVCRLNMQGKTLEQIFAEFHPAWQQQIMTAELEGIRITTGTERNLPEFYMLLVHTAQRERQTHLRDLAYFQRMFETMVLEDPHRFRLYLAKRGDQLLSAALALRVEGHTWDIYSAKWSDQVDDPASILLRWQMIKDAYRFGDHIYDFRGVSTQLDEYHPFYPLLQFKVGFGGDVCELIGEWDYPVVPMLHWAFDMYMKRRT